MTSKWLVTLLVVAAVLAVALPALAQQDKMRMGEAFGAVVIHADPGAQPSPKALIPAEALSPQETMIVVKRPQLAPPAVKKAP